MIVEHDIYLMPRYKLSWDNHWDIIYDVSISCHIFFTTHLFALHQCQTLFLVNIGLQHPCSVTDTVHSSGLSIDTLMMTQLQIYILTAGVASDLSREVRYLCRSSFVTFKTQHIHLYVC